MLDGVSLPYIPDRVKAFRWISGGDGAIGGTIGDIPAARVRFDPERSAVILHRTEPRHVVHRDWAQFVEYLEMDGLDAVAARHLARGLPRTAFAETYTRHAKLVVAGERAEVEERYVGSPHEIVLERAETRGSMLAVEGRVMGHGPARPQQVSIFHLTPNGPEVSRIQTEDDGTFAAAVPGRGPVLLSSVSLSAASASDAAWHGDWASVFLKVQ